MRIRFWGTRGSIARSGDSTLRYGGNTSCVEVRDSRGTLLVLDAGTGAHPLGQALCKSPGSASRGHLLISHTHWDHIQGFPFFGPLFVSGNEWDVYGPRGRDSRLQAALERQMTYEYSPIGLSALEADVRFHDLGEGRLDLGTMRVTARYLNHPALALGYRIEADGAVLVYSCDHEPHSLHPLDAPPATTPVHHEDRRHVRFLEGADLVIHDGQYALDEFPEKSGWGHTPVERAVDYAALAGVKRLVLTHHDPSRDDAEIDRLLEIATARAGACADPPEVSAAADGDVLELGGDRDATQATVGGGALALLDGMPRAVSTVLVVDDDPDMLRFLEGALQMDGVHVLSASDGESALRLARERSPSLLLLDLDLPGIDGMSVCRVLRAEPDARLCDVPILLLTGTKLDESHLVEAFVAGATDYLTKPIKSTLVRSRVSGWLLRSPQP